MTENLIFLFIISHKFILVRFPTIFCPKLFLPPSQARKSVIHRVCKKHIIAHTFRQKKNNLKKQVITVVLHLT